MEINSDNLRTQTAVGFRASREHWLRFLVFYVIAHVPDLVQKAY